MKPIRIQRKRTKGWKMPVNTIYVGRPSKWGNPFIVGKLPDGDWKGIVAFPVSKEQAVGLYKRYFAETWRIGEIIKELKGKNLACWCPLNQKCHADVLLKIANN